MTWAVPLLLHWVPLQAAHSIAQNHFNAVATMMIARQPWHYSIGVMPRALQQQSSAATSGLSGR